MKRLLITFASHSGSTQEIAQFLSAELSARGFAVDVKPLANVTDLMPYEFIIAGGLLYRFGWHPDIVKFLEKNLTVLQKKQVALFVTGMHLVKTPKCDQLSYPVFIDPAPNGIEDRARLQEGARDPGSGQHDREDGEERQQIGHPMHEPLTPARRA